MADRAQIRRWLGRDLYPASYNMADRAWSVRTYIHIGSEKHPVDLRNGLYCVRIAGWTICAASLEKLRDATADAIQAP
jgi:hypothetical protein